MDIDFLVWLGERRTPVLDKFFTLVTYAGGEIFSVAVLCLIYSCLNKRLGVRMMLALFPGILLGQGLKAAFRTPRPWVRSARVIPLESALPEATGYSFPSVHTANSVSAYGTVAREKKKGYRLFWLIPVIVGFSRMYAGVHTPQDVIASFIISVVIVLLSEKLARRLEACPKLDTAVCLAAIALSALIAGFGRLCGDESMTTDCIKLSGASIGAFAGWYLERRSVNFSIPDRFLKRLARIVGGMALVIGVMKGFKAPFARAMGVNAGGFMRYLIVGFIATFIWPWVFTKAGF